MIDFEWEPIESEFLIDADEIKQPKEYHWSEEDKQDILNYFKSFMGTRNSEGMSLAEGFILPGRFPNIKFSGSVFLDNRKDIESLPSGMNVSETLSLVDCSSLILLPNKLVVGGSLYLNGCTSLKYPSQNLKVGKNLHLNNCRSLLYIPETIRVGRDLVLSGCSSLTTLPKNLVIPGDLCMYGCPAIIPKSVQIGGKVVKPFIDLQSMWRRLKEKKK